MSVQQPSNRAVHCELTVLVTRNAAGDLVDGVRERLRRVDGVTAVEEVDVRGLTPGLNDLRVETTVRLRVGVPPDRERDPTEGDESRLEGDEDSPDDAVRSTLESGFGVRSVRLLAVDPATTSTNPASATTSGADEG